MIPFFLELVELQEGVHKNGGSFGRGGDHAELTEPLMLGKLSNGRTHHGTWSG